MFPHTLCTALIEELADSEAALLERLASVAAERDVYRLLGLEAVSAVHHLTIERDRLRASHHRLLDEYRALRERLLGDPE